MLNYKAVHPILLKNFLSLYRINFTENSCLLFNTNYNIFMRNNQILLFELSLICIKITYKYMLIHIYNIRQYFGEKILINALK